MTKILVPVSPAELIDRLTRLQLALQQARPPMARAALLRQIAQLQQAADHALPAQDCLSRLWSDLADTNADLFALWADLCRCEDTSDFGPGFVAMSRAYLVAQNSRHQIKEQINALLENADQPHTGHTH
ncbi:hypothetical protein [Yoonia sp.]|uniref:hypothetical protein n=1 Tax=Yoonia sp. TaxID=2212373 RepID=UPI001A0F69E2|nr:hypothetical protein [Yoonia sp.]MBE0412566.1 hypothetical protein [Yoonia sp.]